MTSSPIRIATHDGAFHVDDVLAVAILTTVFPDHQIIRTRDLDILDIMDIVVDVGDCYDSYFKRYDHHMHNPPCDESGHIYSSAGLVWRHYANDYLKTIGIPSQCFIGDEPMNLLGRVDRHMRIHWIHPVDRVDNGVSQGPTPITEIVRSMRPINGERTQARFNTLFLEAVSMVSHLFKRACFHAADYVIGKTKFIQDDKRLIQDDRIMVSAEPFYNYKLFYTTQAHFVISPSQKDLDTDQFFVIRPISDPITKAYRTSFPADYLGRRREFLYDKTGINGIFYIHHGGFMALADSEESAIAFCSHFLNDCSSPNSTESVYYLSE